MNGSAVSRVNTFFQFVNDRTNPVVIKELRQAVQSRLVIAILLLFLGANVAIVSGYLVLTVDASTSDRAGQDLFTALFVVLVTTCMVFVPLYAAIRLTMERNDSNIDLLFITTIPPGGIIRGKFWAAVMLTALIYSASTPFLTFTYLLRGVDLPSIFFALGTAFFCTAITIMLGIFVGSVAGGLLLRMIMGGGFLLVGSSILIYTIAAGVSTVQFGLGSMFASSDAWGVLSVLVFLGLSAWGLFLLLSVASVSPRSSNRMFPVRLFMTAVWAILGIVAVIWDGLAPHQEPILVWSVVSVYLLSLVLGLILGERESWTPRVRRHIPRTPLLRFLAWMFYTGSAGGVIWCVVLSVTTLLVALAAWPSRWGVGVKSFAEAMMLGVLLYAWCYSMTGLFVRRMVAPRSTPLLGTVIGLMLLAIASSLPLFGAYLIYGPYWRFDSLPVAFVMANPFVLERTGVDREIVFLFLLIWALLGLLVNLSWFRAQWRAFRRHEPKTIPPSAPQAEEPSVVHA